MPKTAQKDASVATVKKQGAVMKHIKKYWQWYAMMFIPIVWGTPMTDTVNAWTCKFAMNQADINNDWDTYVAEVEAQNMQNIVDMYNDTYNANK